MKWITTILLTLAGLILVLPALLVGSTVYALVTLLVTVASVVALREWPNARTSDIPLIAMSALSVAALFLGVHPLFSAISLMLSIYAWNAGNRFGHLERARVNGDAKRQFIIQILIVSLIPPFVIGSLLSAFLYVRFAMPFGLGLALSSASLLSVAGFMVIARAARPREE